MVIKTNYVGLESYQNIKFHFTGIVVGSEKENTAETWSIPRDPGQRKNKQTNQTTTTKTLSKWSRDKTEKQYDMDKEIITDECLGPARKRWMELQCQRL